jgi:hypothetical protein
VKPLNLQEFAEGLRLQGCEFADEILALVALEEEVVEPYATLCDGLDHYAPDGLKNKPERALEWLGDRSAELDEIRACFSEEDMGDAGIPDLIKELQERVPAAPPLEYDL